MGAAGLECLRLISVLVLILGLGGWGEGCWGQGKLALLQLKAIFGFLPDNYVGILGEYALYDWVEQEGKESSDCCKWERVDCNATTGRVIGLSLNTNLFEWEYRWYLNTSLFLPFEELRSLSLSGNQIVGSLDNQGFEKLASKLKKLEFLDLSLNGFNDIRILTSLLEFSSLKSLNFSYNFLSGPISHASTHKGFGGLSRKLSTIEILDLESNDLDDNILVFLSELSSIKYLDLRGNEIKSLDSLHGLINLEVLYLTLNILNSSRLSSFGPFSKCLKFLYINGGHLEGSIDIKQARSLKNVRDSDVVASNNNVLLQHSLSLFPSLRTLNFESDSDINGMVIIQGLLQLKNLESLEIEEIYLQSSFLEKIGELNTSLKILSLPNCGLSGTCCGNRVSFHQCEQLC
ncbi:hypothetical protein DITRI_Ditri15bG0006900 [Diplodiscus trichospermus]